MCLAQGHNTVTPVGLEPAAPQSLVKHSTTEPLCSKNVGIKAGIHQMLARMANREYLDQTASSDLGLILEHLLYIVLFGLFQVFVHRNCSSHSR